jgi:hypothetical protein
MDKCFHRAARSLVWLTTTFLMSAPLVAQDHSQMNMAMPQGWQFMQDGVLFGFFSHVTGPLGEDEFKAPNWWMGMATRGLGSTRLTLDAMFSLDPATVGKSGYRELFQAGESLNGRPLVDRQHPHDLVMQLAAVWRVPIAGRTGLTIAGGPAGEPALGPVAFMHRPSDAEYAFAPLSHHTFDSTHVAFGVVTAAIDHGPFVAEGSVFNGREPDENRWDFDFGRLDSVSGRLWYRPTATWEFQVSTGHLVHPEALEPGNIERTTASGSWLVRNGSDFTAVTVGFGVNVTPDAARHAGFLEATRHEGDNSIFGRLELVQLETASFLSGTRASLVDPSRADGVAAFTIGGVRNFIDWHDVEAGLGISATFYAVPAPLKPSHGDHPMSLQIYFRVRPPAGPMGRMWNMRMSQPMAGHGM